MKPCFFKVCLGNCGTLEKVSVCGLQLDCCIQDEIVEKCDKPCCFVSMEMRVSGEKWAHLCKRSGIVALASNPLPNARTMELRSQGDMFILMRRLRFVILQVRSCINVACFAACLALLGVLAINVCRSWWEGCIVFPWYWGRVRSSRFFASRRRKSYWSGSIKVAMATCLVCFVFLALLISSAYFLIYSTEMQSWSNNFFCHCVFLFNSVSVDGSGVAASGSLVLWLRV